MKVWLLILAALAAGYFGLKPMLRRLIYFPQTHITQHELTELAAAGFESYDNRGFIRRVKDPNKLIVIFHGNAGHAGQRIYMTQALSAEQAVILLAEYPGYGNRLGSPTETNLYAAALEDVKQLRDDYPAVPLILMGESLGSGVAAWLAGKVDPEKLVLISPFTNLADVGAQHYPLLPVRLLIPDRFDSTSYLKDVRVSLLVIHGNRDDVVPFELGKRLFEGYQGPKEFLELEGHAHNDLPWEDVASEMWKKIKGWLTSNLQ